MIPIMINKTKVAGINLALANVIKFCYSYIRKKKILRQQFLTKTFREVLGLNECIKAKFNLDII